MSTFAVVSLPGGPLYDADKATLKRIGFLTPTVFFPNATKPTNPEHATTPACVVEDDASLCWQCMWLQNLRVLHMEHGGNIKFMAVYGGGAGCAWERKCLCALYPDQHTIMNSPTAAPGEYYIVNHNGEPLYAPDESWTCDKKGENRRLMALMYRGQSLAALQGNPDELRKCIWKVRFAPGDDFSFYILNRNDVPLYAPHEHWTCDKTRETRLFNLTAGSSLAALQADADELKKCVWKIRKVPGKDTFYILNRNDEPLYAPHEYWTCDKADGDKRLMALMYRGQSLADLRGKPDELKKCEWALQQVPMT